jgi:RimJ/RimL family protein N-acetyltransferase
MTEDRLGSRPFCIDRAWINVYRLADGTDVTVRMLRPEDREAFLAGFERLSPESRYFRFFTPVPRMPTSVLDRLLQTDGIDHVALSAWRNAGDGAMESIGVARFVRLTGGGDTAEAAIAVVDHMQARGVGRLLLADLCDAARERGIRRFRAEIMVGNEAVIRLLHDVGAKPVAVEGNTAVYELDVPGAPEAEPAHGILVRMLGAIARGLATLGQENGGRRHATGTS